jgi:hypothetical protein
MLQPQHEIAHATVIHAVMKSRGSHLEGHAAATDSTILGVQQLVDDVPEVSRCTRKKVFLGCCSLLGKHTSAPWVLPGVFGALL